LSQIAGLDFTALEFEFALEPNLSNRVHSRRIYDHSARPQIAFLRKPIQGVVEQESLARNHLREASGAIQEASGSHLGPRKPWGSRRLQIIKIDVPLN
jgi:hypothetical protein